MMKQIRFWFARALGEKHSRTLPVKDGVETTITGHLWRGVFYASDLSHKVVNPVAHSNALKQMLGKKPAADERRIFVPGGRR
jgi:hypothetical protein